MLVLDHLPPSGCTGLCIHDCKLGAMNPDVGRRGAKIQMAGDGYTPRYMPIGDFILQIGAARGKVAKYTSIPMPVPGMSRGPTQTNRRDQRTLNLGGHRPLFDQVHHRRRSTRRLPTSRYVG